MASQIVGDRVSLEGQSYIRGHHAYSYCMLWTPAVGEMLILRREPGLLCSSCADIPRSICRVVYYFLAKDSYSSVCEVNVNRVNRGM